MENAYAKSTSEVLKFFSVSETLGLTETQVKASREKHGRNGMYRKFSCATVHCAKTNSFIAIEEEPPTPIWELILEQFKDQLVIILLGSAAISFVLALLEEGGGWTAFVDPAVVCLRFSEMFYHELTIITDSYDSNPERRRRCISRKQRRKGNCRAPRIFRKRGQGYPRRENY